MRSMVEGLCRRAQTAINTHPGPVPSTAPSTVPLPVSGRDETQNQAETGAVSCAQAQSNQGPSASISAVSTVAPHHTRSPGGASR